MNKRLGFLTILAFAGFVLPDELHAQARRCPLPHSSLESFQEEVLEIAAAPTAESGRAVQGWFLRALAPPRLGCPALNEDIDVVQGSDALLRFVAERGDEKLALGFFSALRLAVSPTGERDAIPIPVAALRFAIERDTPGAIFSLQRWAARAELREFLLELTRAERGPATRPELPAELVEVFFLFPTDEDAALRAALLSQPSLVLHPRARCIVESRADRGRDLRDCMTGEIGGRAF